MARVIRHKDVADMSVPELQEYRGQLEAEEKRLRGQRRRVAVELEARGQDAPAPPVQVVAPAHIESEDVVNGRRGLRGWLLGE